MTAGVAVASAAGTVAALTRNMVRIILAGAATKAPKRNVPVGVRDKLFFAADVMLVGTRPGW